MNKALMALFKGFAVLMAFFIVQGTVLALISNASIRVVGTEHLFLSFIVATAVAVFAAYRLKLKMFKTENKRRLADGEIRPFKTYATSIRPLSDKAKSIAEWRGHGWEHLFFARVLLDEIESMRDLRDIHRKGDFQGIHEEVDSELAFSLFQNKLKSFALSLEMMGRLLNEDFKATLECDEPSRKKIMIEDTAYRFGNIYRELILWTFSLRKIGFPNELKKTAEILSSMAEPVLLEIERWSEVSYSEINSVLQGDPLDSVGKKKSLNLVLKIQAPQKLIEEFNAELRRLSGIVENGRL